ncbi:hypothetical protein [Butyrivibrio sp. WCE2006]|uniref:hypothetical protein n=1 Tax=Butyrivibrio sp. WCE2006 TaxID=1410611 RepID=UPI0005D225EB|nr:hypothetical protein [Butyrivibrio sp. WCE2006]
MKKRVFKALITGIMTGILLTGCGSQFPEMTEEEYDQTVQYAVGILMKYSNNGVERLSSLSSLELERQLEKEARDARKAERDAATAEAVANMSQNLEEGEESDTENDTNIDLAQNSDDSAKTEESFGNQNMSEDGSEEESGETNQPENTEDSSEAKDNQNGDELEDDIDNLLDKFGDELDQGIENAGLDENTNNESANHKKEDDVQNTKPVTEETPEGNDDSSLSAEADRTVEGMRQELSKGMFLTYSGYSVAGSYPDNDDIFVINATNGKKLLILNFRLNNTTGTDISVDMVKANPHFQIILNGTNVGYTNVTMLENDLSSFKGMIPSGDKKSMVLIKQMDAGKLKNVESLGLIGDMGGETIEFKLE